MKILFTILISIITLTMLILACEKRKDPFSALNKAPVIQEFSFEDDSLKFTKTQPFDISYLTLKYVDNERQQLTATFNFLTGSGKIFHTLFKEKTRKGNSITFDVPSSFNSDEDGRIGFIPDTIGLVEIELVLSDKVKLIEKTITAFFYKNLDPAAIFTYKLKSSVSPYELEVDASRSHDRDAGKIEWYYWWFGDGTPTVKTGSNTFQHKYQRSGTYTVRLKVEDDEGGLDSTEQAISTNNQPPLAILQVDPVAGEAPLTIHYTATNSSDPDGEIVSYRVDFGDGASSLDSVGSHTYATDNNYHIKLRVQDNLGQTDTTGVKVQVATPPVAALMIAPTEGPFPLDCLIDGTGSYDPQGGKLEHDIYIDGKLTYDNIDSVTHTFDAPEKYLVRLLVKSKRNGLTDEVQQSVKANNLNPNADFVWVPEFPQHRTPVTYSSTSSDPNLTDEITHYKWTFPFGEIVEGEDKTIVIHTFDAGIDTYKVKLEVWDKFRGTKFEGYDSITKIIQKND